MKIDTTHVLRTLDGEELKDQKNKPLTLGAIFTLALLDPEQSKKSDGDEKAKRGCLAFEIQSAKKFIDLDIDALKMLKDLIGEKFPPIVVWQVWPILEKGHNPLTKKQETGNGNKSGENN